VCPDGEVLDEPALLARLARGETAAFDALYGAHRARLFAFLLRLSRRASLAEELAQETWLRFARTAPTLDPLTPVRPWLFRVGRNLFLSHRRRAILDLDGWREDAWVRGGAPLPEPLERLAQTTALRQVERALAGLAVADRELLLLVGVEGMTPLEAASILGLAPEATRQRLARARARLRAALDALDAPAPGWVGTGGPSP
jgi:RNA polymerase sigma factor (sigma-70 family)